RRQELRPGCPGRRDRPRDRQAARRVRVDPLDQPTALDARGIVHRPRPEGDPMNRIMAKALLADAFYQVLDNKVFRLLVLLSIGLVAPTFLVGFREDGVHFLFGWKTFTYKEFVSAFGV